MLVSSLLFAFGIVLPYASEQYAYSKLISAPQKKDPIELGTFLQGYGWRFIWDTAYLFVLVGSGYRIIFTSQALSGWESFGYFIFLFGIILRIWGLKELGRYYDSGIALKIDHQVVQSGPYRLLRHPLHLGTLMQICGLACFSPLWLSLPAGIVSLAVCLYLNYTEDRFHSEQLSSVFQNYYLRSWDIVDLIFWKSKHK